MALTYAEQNTLATDTAWRGRVRATPTADTGTDAQIRTQVRTAFNALVRK